jgi:hypothetical protein
MKVVMLKDMLKFRAEHEDYNIYISNSNEQIFRKLENDELPLKDDLSSFYLFPSEKDVIDTNEVPLTKEFQNKDFYVVK